LKIPLTCPHCGKVSETEIPNEDIARALPPSVVLSRAGKIQQRRRKKKAGGRPAKLWPCRWCQTPIYGRSAVEAHEKTCIKNPNRAR
jgi:hypothetical protein